MTSPPPWGHNTQRGHCLPKNTAGQWQGKQTTSKRPFVRLLAGQFGTQGGRTFTGPVYSSVQLMTPVTPRWASCATCHGSGHAPRMTTSSTRSHHRLRRSGRPPGAHDTPEMAGDPPPSAHCLLSRADHLVGPTTVGPTSRIGMANHAHRAVLHPKLRKKIFSFIKYIIFY